MTRSPKGIEKGINEITEKFWSLCSISISQVTLLTPSPNDAVTYTTYQLARSLGMTTKASVIELLATKLV